MLSELHGAVVVFRVSDDVRSPLELEDLGVQQAATGVVVFESSCRVRFERVATSKNNATRFNWAESDHSRNLVGFE